MARNHINPPLTETFDAVYCIIQDQAGMKSPELKSTGGTLFTAEAKITVDGRKYISLPHNNRIYECDWGFTANSMGVDGQRIAQYSVPLDQWAATTKG